MEKSVPKLDLDQVWSKDGFSRAFGFVEINKVFSKEIGDQKYTFKQIKTPQELKEAQEVLRNGFEWLDIEIPPVHVLALWEDTGGGNFAAYTENGKMIGYAGGMGGGIDTLTKKPTIISSMLAMNGKEFRSSGVGKELKIIQAYFAKQNGYEVMKWLYDPERGENASLNMRKLGARAEEFWVDKYGRMESSVFGGVPTDRFRAVWRFTKAQTVYKILGITPPLNLENTREIKTATHENLPNEKRVLVEVSSDIDAIRKDEIKIERRLNLRKILSYYFERKYIATDFISSVVDNERKNFYLLEIEEISN